MKFKVKAWLTIDLVLLLFILDRVLKIYFYYVGAEPVFLSRFISFHTEFNEGVAFGIHLPTLIIVPLVVAILALLVYFATKAYQEKNYFVFVVLNLIIAGGFSNFIDRFKYNYVIDYIDLKYFTVFNVADVMITLGVGLLVLDRLRIFNKK
ncbi:signal peptidase II [Patescibacteria group bacterium]|nr:signal peptidase II [Patescibacteria group bacterium]